MVKADIGIKVIIVMQLNFQKPLRQLLTINY